MNGEETVFRENPTIDLESIPIINISDLINNNSGKLDVANQINFACRKFGFFYIVGHGVCKNLMDNLETLSRQFFAQPLEEKEKIRMEFGGRAWRGYFPVGGELTSGKPDMKEGIYFGAELKESDPLVQKKTPLHGPNLFPDNIPCFKETVLEYLNAMTTLGQRLMEGIALSLNLEENYFSDLYTKNPLPLFRIFNYPALAEKVAKESWGVGEHTDYGVLTILKQDDLGGLQVKSISQWIEAPPIPDSFVCNIGDMLDKMTAGLYRSTPHRVKNPSTRIERLSFPFFFDPNFHSEVKAINVLQSKGLDDDVEQRWDKSSVHQFSGTYGDYLLNKVSKVFPELSQEVL